MNIYRTKADKDKKQQGLPVSNDDNTSLCLGVMEDSLNQNKKHTKITFSRKLRINSHVK